MLCEYKGPGFTVNVTGSFSHAPALRHLREPLVLCSGSVHSMGANGSGLIALVTGSLLYAQDPRNQWKPLVLGLPSEEPWVSRSPYSFLEHNLQCQILVHGLCVKCGNRRPVGAGESLGIAANGIWA